MTEQRQPPTLRALAPSVFLPALVYEIGNGALAPVIALSAVRLGASAGGAAFVLALLGVGRIIGDVPAAWLAERMGDRRSMMVAAALSVACALVCLVPSLVALAAAITVIGAASATFYLARQSYLMEVAPAQMRARAMSTLGGSHRIGLFIGPFAGALAITIAGLPGAYVVAALASLATLVLLALVPDVEVVDERQRTPRGEVGSLQVLGEHRRLFSTLGIAILTVGAVRAARQTVIPLWADHIGLSAETTSIVFGVASAVDMALFYPAGKVMDRHGRLWVAVPSMLLLGITMMLLPLADTAVALTAVAMTMSFGNGIGSGIMMTLGADAAPVVGRLRFLGIWRLLSDAGNAGGPVIVSIVASAATLAAGIVAVGSTGLLAAAALARWVPRYSPFATRRHVRAAAQPRDEPARA